MTDRSSADIVDRRGTVSNTSQAPGTDHEQAEPEIDANTPRLVDLIHCAKTDPPNRDYLVEGLIPLGVNILGSGHGGLGKSTIFVLRMALCVAAGVEYLGQPTRRAVVVILSCEDNKDELHRRLKKEARAIGIDLASLVHRLFIYDATGRDAALFGRRSTVGDRYAIVGATPEVTPRFEWLRERVEGTGAELVILDSLSDTFDASEIDRAQVRRYFTTCLGLFGERRGSVLHIGHVDKASVKYGSMGQTYSGSTAINNSVRARLALLYATTAAEGEGAEDDGRRLIVVEKSNYGRPGLTIALRYDEELGTFVRDAEQPTGTVAHIRDTVERKALLKLLIECERLNKTVTVAERANGNAAVILGEMQDYPKALKTGPGKKRLWSHLRRLVDDRFIEAETFKTPAKKTSERWKVTELGRAEVTQ